MLIWKVTKPGVPIEIANDEIFLSIRFHTTSNDFLLTGSFDKILRMWSVKDNKSVDWIKVGDFITCIEFSPKSEYFVVGFLEGKFTVYEYKGSFIQLFTSSIKNLHTYNEKKDLDQQTIETKKTNSLLEILFKKRMVNNKIVRILFPSKTNENEFFILNYSGQLKLVSKEKNYAIIENYKSNHKNIPISIDWFESLVLMNSEYGASTFWIRNNYFIPVFNPIIFKSNLTINCSTENYWPFKTSDSMNYFVSAFLSKEFVDRYNAKHPDKEVEYFILSLTCTGFVKIDRKLKQI